MIDKNKNVVMVVEKSTTKLNLKETDGRGYILEGIFTRFGIVNRNNRIYEEAEYLPHLDYLNKKISSGRLVGELDHPEKFDVSLTNASHVIEKLEYNKDDRTITGRIRLLSTDAGVKARQLVDDGVQLSISSRAAGVVRENNTVQIKKIFTYDLVADPGFDDAQLNRINESVGYGGNDNIAIFEMNMSENDLLEEIRSIDMITSNKKEITEYKYINENKIKDMDSYIKQEEFEKFHNYISEQFSNLESQLNKKDRVIKNLQNTINLHENYLDYVKDETNKIVENSGNVENSSELETVIKYADHIANESNKVIKYTKYLANVVDRTISYNEHQANEHNLLENYIENHLVEGINENINESEKHRSYTKYLAGLVDKGLQYTESIAEEVKYIIEHNDTIVENVNSLISYSDHVTNTVNAGLNYSNYLSEELNKANGDIDAGSYLGINENRNDAQILIDNSKTIGSKFDRLLENIQTQKNVDNAKQANNAYFNLLNESKKREFLLLTENEKQKVVAAVKKEMPLSGSEFVQIWEKALNPIVHEDYVQILLEGMPNDYKPVWESLDRDAQERIIAQSKYTNINLDNQYAISNFWSTRSILNEKLEFQPLNEAETIVEGEKNKSLGYQNNYLNGIANSLDRYKNK